jgi:hypothetical protein
VSVIATLAPEFVEEIPRELVPGRLYISVAYGTATHLCCCGCGHEVVTPIHPTRWAFAYDGEAISLWPSVGSWSLPCQSHYVIRNNRVCWAPRWSEEMIEAGRARNRRERERHFSPVAEACVADAGDERAGDLPGKLHRLWHAITGR